MADRRWRSPESFRRRTEYARAENDDRGMRSGIDSLSSSSSSFSYLEISRSYPPKKSILRTFFTAPSERRRLRKRRSNRLLNINNSSSSSINDDLAYGTGFIRVPKRRGARLRKAKEVVRERERDRYRDSDRERSGNHRAPATEAEILAVGEGLAKLARDQNKLDLKAARYGGRPEVIATKRSSSNYIYGTSSRVLGPSDVRHGSDSDEDGWESASDAGSESSVDSKLAFGNGNQSSGFFGWGKKSYGPLSRKSSIVDPRLFGPENSLRGVVTEPVGFEDVYWTSTSDFGQRSNSYVTAPEERVQSIANSSKQSLEEVYPVPTSDPSIFIAGPEASISSRPASIPLQQPQPFTPVSQSIYEPTYTARSDPIISKKTSSSSGRGTSLAQAALVGVAGAAVGATLASNRGERKDKSRNDDQDWRDEERLVKRRDTKSESSDARKKSKRESPDRKEKRRDKDRHRGETRSEEERRREKKREKRHEDETKEERRERHREKRRPKSEISVSSVDPFQYQVPNDDFPTPTESTPSHARIKSLANIITVEPESTRKRSYSIQEQSSTSQTDPPKDYYERNDRNRDSYRDSRDRALHEAESLYRETEQSTAPIEATIMATTVAAITAEAHRESRSEQRRGERRSDYDSYKYDSKKRDGSRGRDVYRGEDDYRDEHQGKDRSRDKRSSREPERDLIQEEADRAYREIVMARKIASQVIRQRTPSPDRSVVDKYEDNAEQQVFRIVTPPGMEEHKKQGPYDAPNADFNLDHVFDPTDLHSQIPYVSLSRSYPDRGANLKRDPDAEKPRPLLNLVRPTPTPTPVPEKQIAQSEPAESSPKEPTEYNKTSSAPASEKQTYQSESGRKSKDRSKSSSSSTPDKEVSKSGSRKRSSSSASEKQTSQPESARGSTDDRSKSNSSSVPEKQVSQSEPGGYSQDRNKPSSISKIVIGSKEQITQSPTSATPTSSTVSKGVTWGQNETKHFDVESPSDHREEFINTDRPLENSEKAMGSDNSKRSGWGAIAAGIMGTGVDTTTNSSESSKTSKNKEKETRDDAPYEYRGVVVEPESPQTSERQRNPPSTGPKPSSIQSSRVPGAFDDDLDFTATVAAGLKDTGFDPNIVIDDPTFRHRDSPPGSNESRFYKTPYAETVSDIGYIPDSSRSGGYVIGEVLDTPKDWPLGVSPDDEYLKLSNTEQKQRDKAAKRQSADVTSLEEMPIVKEVEEPGIYSEPKLSKKEQKKRDRAAQRQSSQADDVTPLDNFPVSREIVEEPESYFETPKKSKKKSKKGSSTFNDDSEDSPRDGQRVSIPVEYFDDIQNGEEEWDVKKSKKKSKRDSDRFDSPSRSSPTSPKTSELERPSSKKSKRDSDRFDSPSRSGLASEVTSELERSSSKKSKDKPRRKSDNYEPDPTEVSLPPSTPSEGSRDDYDDSRWSRRISTKDSGIFDSADRGDSRSIVSTGTSRYDDEEARKSKKKRHSSRDDFDDTRSVASAPAVDEFEDSKKKKKDKEKRNSGSFFGLFGSKSESGARDESLKLARDDFEEPKKKSKKSKRGSIQDSSDVYGTLGSQSVSDIAHISSNGNSNGNGSRHHVDLDNGSRSDDDKRKSRQADEASSKPDSFLAKAGTSGAGVGLAMAAVAIAAQHHQQSEADNSKSKKSSRSRNSSKKRHEEENSSSPSSSREIDDPGIVQRQFRPSIDPQYGDLLPLPPSRLASPIDNLVDEFPELPESRPDTPDDERIASRDKMVTSARRWLQETPVKTPSHSAVPLKFIIKTRSTPSSPSSFKAPPLTLPSTPTPDSLTFQRVRSRPTSWDSTKEYKPLYLVESNRRLSNSHVHEEILPALPPSQRTSRSSSHMGESSKEATFEYLTSDDQVRFMDPLSIDTRLQSSSKIDLLDSEQSTPKAEVPPHDFADVISSPSRSGGRSSPTLDHKSDLLETESPQSDPASEVVAAAPVSSIEQNTSTPIKRSSQETWQDELPSQSSSTQPQPSPVDPMSKDRSSYLLQSSPTSRKDEDFAGIQERVESDEFERSQEVEHGEEQTPVDDMSLAKSEVIQKEETSAVAANEEAESFGAFFTKSKKVGKLLRKTRPLADTQPGDDFSLPKSKKDKKRGKSITALESEATPIEPLPSTDEPNQENTRDVSEGILQENPTIDESVVPEPKKYKKKKGKSMSWQPEEEAVVPEGSLKEPVLDANRQIVETTPAADEFPLVDTKKGKKKGKKSQSWVDNDIEADRDPEPVVIPLEQINVSVPSNDVTPAESSVPKSKKSKKKSESTAFQEEDLAPVEDASQSKDVQVVTEESTHVEESVLSGSKKNKKKSKNGQSAVQEQAPDPDLTLIEPAVPESNDRVFEEFATKGPKKGKKKSRKPQAWDDDETPTSEKLPESSQDTPIDPELSSAPEKSFSEATLVTNEHTSAPNTDYFPSMPSLHSPIKQISQDDDSQSKNYFPSATDLLPAVAASAAILGENALQEDLHHHSEPYAEPEIPVEKLEHELEPEALKEVAEQPSTEEYAKESKPADEQQEQPAFTSPMETKSELLPEPYSEPKIPIQELEHEHEPEAPKEVEESIPTASEMSPRAGKNDLEAVSEQSAPGGLSAGYKDDQLSLARQLQQEFSSSNRKSKKDKKKRQSLPATPDPESSRSRDIEEPAGIHPRARSLSIGPTASAKISDERKSLYSQEQLEQARQLKAEFEDGNKRSKKDKKKRQSVAQDGTMSDQFLAEPETGPVDTSELSPNIEQTPKGDGFAAGYQEDQLSLARQLQAEFGSGTKKPKKEKKRRSTSQTPIEQSDDRDDYFFDATQDEAAESQDNKLDSATDANPADKNKPDGLAIGYSEDQLELARQLKEEFGSGSRKGKKDKKGRKRESLLRSTTDNGFSSDYFEDSEESRSTPIQQTENIEIPATELSPATPEDTSNFTEKRSKKGKKRQSLLRSTTEDDFSSKNITEDLKEPIDQLPVQEDDVAKPAATVAGQEDEVISTTKKLKKDKKGKKRASIVQDESEEVTPSDNFGNEVEALHDSTFPQTKESEAEPSESVTPATEDDFAPVVKKSKKDKRKRQSLLKSSTFNDAQPMEVEETNVREDAVSRELGDGNADVPLADQQDDNLEYKSKKSKKGKKKGQSLLQSPVIENLPKEDTMTGLEQENLGKEVGDSILIADPAMIELEKQDPALDSTTSNPVEKTATIAPEGSFEDFAFSAKEDKEAKKKEERQSREESTEEPAILILAEHVVEPELNAAEPPLSANTPSKNTTSPTAPIHANPDILPSIKSSREILEEPEDIGSFSVKRSKKDKKRKSGLSTPIEQTLTEPALYDSVQNSIPLNEEPIPEIIAAYEQQQLEEGPGDEEWGSVSAKKSKKDKKKRKSGLSTPAELALDVQIMEDTMHDDQPTLEPPQSETPVPTELSSGGILMDNSAPQDEEIVEQLKPKPELPLSIDPVIDFPTEVPTEGKGSFSTKKSKKDKKKRQSGTSTPAELAVDGLIVEEIVEKNLDKPQAKSAILEGPGDEEWGSVSTKKSKKDKKKQKSGISTPLETPIFDNTVRQSIPKDLIVDEQISEPNVEAPDRSPGTEEWRPLFTKSSKKDKKKRQSGLSTPVEDIVPEGIPVEGTKSDSIPPLEPATQAPEEEESRSFSVKMSKKDKKKPKSGLSTPVDQDIQSKELATEEPTESLVPFTEPVQGVAGLQEEDDVDSFSIKESKKDKKKRKSGRSTPVEYDPISTVKKDNLQEELAIQEPVSTLTLSSTEPPKEVLEDEGDGKWDSFSAKGKKNQKHVLATPLAIDTAMLANTSPRDLKSPMFSTQLSAAEIQAQLDSAKQNDRESTFEGDESEIISKSKKDKKGKKLRSETEPNTPVIPIESSKEPHAAEKEEPLFNSPATFDTPGSTIRDEAQEPGISHATLPMEPTKSTVEDDGISSDLTRTPSKKDKRKRQTTVGSSTDDPDFAPVSTSWAEEVAEAEVIRNHPIIEDIAEDESLSHIASTMEATPVNDFFRPTKKGKKGKKRHSTLIESGNIAEPSIPSTEDESSLEKEALKEQSSIPAVTLAGAALAGATLLHNKSEGKNNKSKETQSITTEANITPAKKLSKKQKRKQSIDKRSAGRNDMFDDPILWEDADPKQFKEMKDNDNGSDGFWSAPQDDELGASNEELVHSSSDHVLGGEHDTIEPPIIEPPSEHQPITGTDGDQVKADAQGHRGLPRSEQQLNDLPDGFLVTSTKKDNNGNKASRLSGSENPQGDWRDDMEDVGSSTQSLISASPKIDIEEPQTNRSELFEQVPPLPQESHSHVENEPLITSNFPSIFGAVNEPDSEKRASFDDLPPSTTLSSNHGFPLSTSLPVVPEEVEQVISQPTNHGIEDANRDSAFVTGSPAPPEKRAFADDHEHVRDSGVHLQDESPAEQVRAPVSTTDDAIAGLSWPSVDEETETVDLERSQRPKIVEPAEEERGGRRSHTPKEGHSSALHRSPTIHRTHRLTEEKGRSPDLPSQKLGQDSIVKRYVERIESPDLQRAEKSIERPRRRLDEDTQYSNIHPLLRPKEDKYKDLGLSERPKANQPKSLTDTLPLAAPAIGAAVPLGFAAARQASRESRPDSAQSQRSSNINRLRTPDPKYRPDSVNSSRSSGTPPLRRSDRKISGDLRSLSQRSKLDLAKEAELASINISTPSVNTYPTANEGRVRAKDMADVYDGFGEGRIGSPMSPTRPHSMRRRQSMQVLDLESRLEQLAAENRSLAEAKTQAEYLLQSSQHAPSPALVERDAEIDSLKRTLEWLQNEVTRLTEVNDGLTSANITLGTQHNDRYGMLESQHANTLRELQQNREEHHNLSSGMEGKDREIAELRAELDIAKKKIREMQRQILSSKANDSEFLTIRDEDYFDSACQQLCQHVQQWVLRFSKFSDMRACRLTSEINNDKIIDRLDNAILDGSDVDSYLADRIKRRDVFMSMTMTMIWEFVFTRYLFGMDREQRQKLKSLEKILSEVGPQAAVHQWRATTLTLLAKREAFAQQREQDTLAVVNAILETLTEILPPPSHLESQIEEQLERVMKAAVDLSIEMRTQRAEYMMLPPLQPEYDANGDLASKVSFNAALMNERSGDTISNEELEEQKAVVRIVLFPLVVKKGDDRGEGDEEIVVCPAQVLVAKPKKHVRMFSPENAGGNQSRISMQSSMPANEGEGSVI
ncbi:hypothetical protein B7494_g2143 [Chlorociboria aeruginascens]|nr:hypothetical protein B7494_g2143 [Chlorociboria aeruginascens]